MGLSVNMKSIQKSFSNGKLPEFLVIGIMPFLYGAATRLPFIYYVIHLTNFDLDWLTIGLCVAAYQGCRVIASAFSIVAPRLSHFIGTLAGFAGYSIVYIYDNDMATPFIVGTAIIGFSETMASMQKYAKEMYNDKSNGKKAQVMIKFQYASVMIGVVFAFCIGGFVYEIYYINGIAIFGMIIEGLALIAFFSFLIYENKDINLTHFDEEDRMKNNNNDIVKLSGLDRTDINITENTVEPAIFDRTDIETTENSVESTILHSSKDTEEEQEELDILSTLHKFADAQYSTADLPPTWVNWLLCITFGIEALTIGTNLSIGPLFLLNEFNQGTGMIGVLFAVGAASGTSVAIGVTCTKFGNKALKKIASSPFDLCFAMGGIAVGILVAAIPNFVLHVIGLILLMCFNDLGATLMTELQASITTVSNYSFLGPLGQVIRRSLNVVTALSSPILYGIFARFPYFIAGGITFLWTFMLFMVFQHRTRQTINKISDRTGSNRKEVKSNTNFSEAEILRAITKQRQKIQQRRSSMGDTNFAQAETLEVGILRAITRQKPKIQQRKISE